MAFTGNYSCNTLRTALVNGTIDFATDVFYLALYTNSATLDQTTTAYTAVGEASGGNYAAGGQQVTASVGTQTTSFGSIIFIDFSAPQWTGAITARGALIYRYSDGLAIAVARHHPQYPFGALENGVGAPKTAAAQGQGGRARGRSGLGGVGWVHVVFQIKAGSRLILSQILAATDLKIPPSSSASFESHHDSRLRPPSSPFQHDRATNPPLGCEQTTGA